MLCEVAQIALAWYPMQFQSELFGVERREFCGVVAEGPCPLDDIVADFLDTPGAHLLNHLGIDIIVEQALRCDQYGKLIDGLHEFPLPLSFRLDEFVRQVDWTCRRALNIRHRRLDILRPRPYGDSISNSGANRN